MVDQPDERPQPEEIDIDDPEIQRRFKSKAKGNGSGARSSMLYEWEPLDANEAYLVKGRLPRVGVGALIAHGYTGKTQSCIDLTGAVITDRFWAAARCMRPGGVVWMAAEGAKGVRRSWDAHKELVLRPWYEHQGLELPADFPFVTVLDNPPLLKNKTPNPSSIKYYVERIEEAKAVFKKKFGVETVLAIFDTLAKVAVFKDENDNAECTNAFMALDRISQDTDLFCLATDHLPKDEAATKPRGGGAKYNSADSILRISRGEGQVRKLHVDKVRDGDHGAEITFNLVKVQRGVDPDGDPITAIRIAWSGEYAPGASKRPPGPAPKHKNELLNCLDWAHGLGVSERIATPHYGSVFAAPCDKIREEWTCRTRTSGQTEKSLDDMWNRAVRQVRDAHLAATYEIVGKGVFMFRVPGDEMRQDATN